MQNLLILFGVVSLILGCFLIFLGKKEEEKTAKCLCYSFGFIFFVLFAVSMIKDTEVSNIIVYPLF